MIRLLFIAPLGVTAALLVFWGMQKMIAPSAQEQLSSEQVAMVDFIRALKDSRAEQKDRTRKEPPKPKKPPLPQTPQVAQQQKASAPDLNMPPLDAVLNSFKGAGMGSMLGGYGFGDSDVIPLVQVEPRYPQKAIARKIEGYVVLRMQINEKGTVDSVEVVEAQPKGIFEREAIKAAWRYRFKAKLVDGKPVPQVATLPFEFNLKN